MQTASPVETLPKSHDIPSANQLSDDPLSTNQMSDELSHDLSAEDELSDVVSSDNDELVTSGGGLSEGSNWDYYQVRTVVLVTINSISITQPKVLLSLRAFMFMFLIPLQ